MCGSKLTGANQRDGKGAGLGRETGGGGQGSERIVSSETSALKAQTPRDNPKNTIRQTSPYFTGPDKRLPTFL